MATVEKILSGLNPPQRQAAMHVDGPLLVLAGAGSGKTSTLTRRIGYLLHRGIAPENILAMTFTNKAAGEMRERAAQMVGKKVAERLHLSTFHALGAELLRTHIGRLGFRRPFSILDQGDQVRLVKDVMEDMPLKSQAPDAKKIHAIISRAKNAFCEPRALKSMRFNPLVPFAQNVFTRYVEACRSLNAVDFDDLITLPVELLSKNEDLREAIRAQFQYVMVDEYQDTNDTQLELLSLICNPRNNLCAVGDDDQSIYAFRGAVAQNILDFDKQFPGAKVIKLEQNYRSTTTILKSANAIIGNNRQRRDKTLWSALGEGERLSYFELENESEESDFVAGDIHRQHVDGGQGWSSFAVLMRVAAISRPFEESMRALDIPYKLVGGKSFFDRREVKDLVAYMKVMLNPKDEISLRRVINTPRRSIGAQALTHLNDYAQAHRLPLHVALRQCEMINELAPSSRRGMREFVEILDEFKGRFEREPLGVALAGLIDKLAYEEWLLQSEKSEKVARIRLENVKELKVSVEDFWKRQGSSGLDAWLARLTLDTSPTEKPEDRVDQVTLMTLHASKGLEFPQVYLVGFEEEILPHSRSLEAGGDGDLEEERRLAYVGITRAKERLVLTSARKRGRGQMARQRTPSRFLAEIPEELISRQLASAGGNQNAEASRAARKRHLAAMREILFNE